MKMNASYKLRENPKKSIKLSASVCHPDDMNISCQICGKAFLNRRQLCGHLRHHTIGERQGTLCNQCGKRFRSIRALCGHMKIHSEGSIRALDVQIVDCSVFLIGKGVVTKRARTPRFEIPERRRSNSLQQHLNEQQVAISLIMLSQGLEFCASASDLPVNIAGDVELVERLKSESVDEMGSATALYFPQMDLDISYKNPYEPKTMEFDPRVKDETSLAHFNVGNSNVICDHGKPQEVEDAAGICSVVSGSNKQMYRCINCNKDFKSHQALGGHRSSKHKLRKCSSVLKFETCQSSNQADHIIPAVEATSGNPECTADDGNCIVGAANLELLKKCMHKCTLCFDVFCWSAQALEAHMVAHVAESTMTMRVSQGLLE